MQFIILVEKEYILCKYLIYIYAYFSYHYMTTNHANLVWTVGVQSTIILEEFRHKEQQFLISGDLTSNLSLSTLPVWRYGD